MVKKKKNISAEIKKLKPVELKKIEKVKWKLKSEENTVVLGKDIKPQSIDEQNLEKRSEFRETLLTEEPKQEDNFPAPVIESDEKVQNLEEFAETAPSPNRNFEPEKNLMNNTYGAPAYSSSSSYSPGGLYQAHNIEGSQAYSGAQITSTFSLNQNPWSATKQESEQSRLEKFSKEEERQRTERKEADHSPFARRKIRGM